MSFAFEFVSLVAWVVFGVRVLAHVRGARRDAAEPGAFTGALHGMGRASWSSRGATRAGRAETTEPRRRRAAARTGAPGVLPAPSAQVASNVRVVEKDSRVA